MDRISFLRQIPFTGRWVSDAENLATNVEDRGLFHYNALNQVTLWGPTGEISDYAGKQWSGLVRW